MLELKFVETENKFSLWSCLPYIFLVEDDGGNARNEIPWMQNIHLHSF